LTQARVVGLLDILGFKGIWNQHDPRAVLAQMKHLRAQALPLPGHRKTGVLLRDEGFRHDVKFISDTVVIVVTLSHSEIPERFLYRALHSACLIAGDIIDEAASGTPAFALRGCLAAGALRIDGNFVIGPAVDEAAHWFEQAEGAFFWLTDSAMAVNNRYAETFIDRLDP
jgi:hypothetical protein